MAFYGLGEVRPPKDSDFDHFKFIALDDTHWKRKVKKKKVEVYTRCTDCSNVKIIKLIAILSDVSAEVLYDTLHDSAYRSQWDDTMRDGFEICRVSWNSLIEYYALKPPFAFASRDFVMQRVWTLNQDDYIMFNRSVFHRAVPPKHDCIRALTFLTGYLITPIDQNSCRLIYITQSDPRGDIPAWAMNLAVTKIAPRIMKNLHRAAINYPAWKAQNNPNFKPWRYVEQQSHSLPLVCMDDILNEPDFPLKKITENHVNKEAAMKELDVNEADADKLDNE